MPLEERAISGSRNPCPKNTAMRATRILSWENITLIQCTVLVSCWQIFGVRGSLFSSTFFVECETVTLDQLTKSCMLYLLWRWVVNIFLDFVWKIKKGSWGLIISTWTTAETSFMWMRDQVLFPWRHRVHNEKFGRRKPSSIKECQEHLLCFIYYNAVRLQYVLTQLLWVRGHRSVLPNGAQN